MFGGNVTPSGELSITIVKRSPETDRLRALMRDIHLGSNLGHLFLDVLPYLPARLAGDLLEQLRSVVVIESALSIKVFRLNGFVEDHGIVGHKVVTTAGVNAIVDAFQNTVELENFKYHGLGTGATAEAIGDTALVTELTTEYTGNVRATGTTTEGATANVYRTVATNTLDGTPGAALREHGVFSANAAGTLLDRTVYAAVTIVSGEGMQTQYNLSFVAGS